MYTELGGVSIRNRLAPFNHAFLNIGRGLLKVHREFLDQQIFKKGPCWDSVSSTFAKESRRTGVREAE